MDYIFGTLNKMDKNNGIPGEEKKAYLFAVLAILAWSTVASAFKLTLAYISPMELLSFASAFAFLALLALTVLSGSAREFLSMNRNDVAHSLVAGLLNPFLYYIVLFTAYDRLPAQLAQPLNYTWPLILTVFSAILLRQKIGGAAIFGVFVSFTGIVFILTGGGTFPENTDWVGAALALGSGFIWAAYWIMNMRDSRSAKVKLTASFLAGTIFSFTLLVIVEGVHLPSLAVTAGAAYVGLFEMGITFLLWMKALSLSRNTALVGGLVYLSPFISLVFIHGLVGEVIHAYTIVGLALIVGGILISRKRTVKSKE